MSEYEREIKNNSSKIKETHKYPINALKIQKRDSTQINLQAIKYFQ